MTKEALEEGNNLTREIDKTKKALIAATKFFQDYFVLVNKKAFEDETCFYKENTTVFPSPNVQEKIRKIIIDNLTETLSRLEQEFSEL